MAKRKSKLSLLALVVFAVGLSAFAFLRTASPDRHSVASESLAIFGTIPIYWGESASMADMLAGEGEPHWARAVLEERYDLKPLDTLDAASLETVSQLMLPQPRVLSGEENVALDEWVRDGGKLLLFADPMLTSHSHFGIGDKRRPQDVILLSPILNRWGLQLVFDDELADSPRVVSDGDSSLTVLQYGTFELVDTEAQSACELKFDSVVAACRIGSGDALIVGDAALLDEESTRDQLLNFTELAFANR